MIIATAGHVDHGKTSLIRQLTGVETDTLAEERERGLSINLGYAYLPLPEGSPLGFIDVPGHQRFINTMISGISGIDMGLLVVAADDGPMPQTLEHLDVLDILGVDLLTVVISKTDRASDARIADVEQQAHTLLAPRRWQQTAFFGVSSTDGRGVADLKEYLLQQAGRLHKKRVRGGFRLSIDRCFTARGSGLIVTGTASAGQVRIDDKLQLLPGHKQVRVRGLRVHDQDADTAQAGQRVALNLTGKVEKSDIQRGDWLVDPRCPLLSSRLDVALSLLPSAPFSLKHLAPVKLYIGAKRVAGRLAIVECMTRQLQPGDQCLAQLILEQPVSAMHGERFLLRDHAEDVILGGGTILDPQGPRYGKSRPGRLTWLKALQLPTVGQSLASLLEQNQLVNLERFWGMRNFPAVPASNALPTNTRQFDHDGKHWAVSRERWSAASEEVRRRVHDWHRVHPESPGIKMTDLKPALAHSVQPALAVAVLVSQVRAGELLLREGHISRRGFQADASKVVVDYWHAIRRHLKHCRHNIPLISELLEATQIPEKELRQVVKAATKAGDLHRLNDNRYALPEQLLHFSQCVIEADSEGEELSVIKLKSRFGSGRKLTIELLEYFDSIHFTRRAGDRRIIVHSDVAMKRFGV